MSSPERDPLDGHHDLAGLRAALNRLCRRYGRLQQLTILPANRVGRQQALCFLRMASHEEEQRIMTALGIGRFGGELVLVVNLRAASPRPADAATPTRSAPFSLEPPPGLPGAAAAAGPAR